MELHLKIDRRASGRAGKGAAAAAAEYLCGTYSDAPSRQIFLMMRISGGFSLFHLQFFLKPFTKSSSHVHRMVISS